MSGLPSGYTQLEYIQSSGAQYINTGFKPNNNTRVFLTANLTSTPTGNTALFGARTSANSKNYAMLFIPPSFRSDYNNTYTQTWQITATTKRTYDKNKETTTIDAISKSYTNALFQADYALYLFAINSAGISQWYASMQMYACQIYDNGTLVRDFVPCKNASGAVGLYDTVEGHFYANAETGTFTAGPEIPAPEAPTALQTVLAVALQWAASANADRYDVYRNGAKLGSTEGTQYVDTTPEVNQTYVYTVKAVNGGGASAGTSITVYTKSGYFEYKPLIESANFP